MDIELLLFILGSLILVGGGYYWTVRGWKAIKSKEKPIGTYDPKMNFLMGIVLILGGIALFIRLVFFGLAE